MTSRERIISAINHVEPDRVPVDLGATPSSGISGIAYANLTKYLDIKNTHTRVYDIVQELAQVEDPLIELFGIDVLDIGRSFNTNNNDWKPYILGDGTAAESLHWFNPVKEGENLLYYDEEGDLIAMKPAGASFFDQKFFPYVDGYPENYNNIGRAMNKVLWQSMAHTPWEHASDPDFWTDLRNNCIDLKKNSDKALMIMAGCNLFEWGTFLRRMDNFLTDLYLEEKNVEAMLDALIEKHLENLERICRAVGDTVDIIRLGDDLGTNSGPFMEPELYRKFFKPRHKILTEYIKKNSRAHVFLHSCGSIYKVIPDLIEAGFEILNPVQTNAFEMDPLKLKKEFGNDICFWGGGVDTRSVLNNGTPEEVKKQVHERLTVFSKGGGFVFNTVHNILPDVPPKNIVAMFEAIKEFN